MDRSSAGNKMPVGGSTELRYFFNSRGTKLFSFGIYYIDGKKIEQVLLWKNTERDQC
jgi:hypothetical protein